MVVHRDGCLAPNPAGVFEPANQFALLGVDADNGRLLPGEAAPLALEVVKLPVAFRTRGAEALAVGMQGVAEFFQQTADGVGARVNAQPAQQAADLAQPQTGPQSSSAHGIAGGIRREQRAERVQELGRSFFQGLAPATLPPDPILEDLSDQQFAPTTRDGRHVQTQQCGHALVAPMTPLQTLQSGVQPALLFV